MLAHASPAAPEGPVPGAKGPPGPVGAPGGPKGAPKGPKRGSRALNQPQTGPSGFGDFWIIHTFQMGPDERSAGQALQTAKILLDYTAPLGRALVQPMPALIPYGRDYY